MGEVFNIDDFLWKMVERDIDKFFKGEREMCAANVGRALGFGLLSEIDKIKACWVEAHRVKAAKMQKEGA